MNTVLILLSEPFADWEAAYICPELNKLEDYEIKTVSLSKIPVTTMGGLKVLPDYDIENIYGFSVSETTISDTTNKLLPKIEDWQDRLLSTFEARKNRKYPKPR